jgi:hypothetical protein
MTEKPKPPTAPIREGESLHDYAVRLGLKVEQQPGAALMVIGYGRPSDGDAFVPWLPRSMKREPEGE